MARPEGFEPPDLLIRSQMLCPTELRAYIRLLFVSVVALINRSISYLAKNSVEHHGFLLWSELPQ